MAQVNAGRVRFVSKGEYNNSTQYYLFDLVNYNGNSYYAKENTLGNLPTDTSKWQLIAEKGDTGATGQTGATGNGISNIQKTSTSGLVDTYTITYTDGTTTTYEVTNGEDGEVTQEQLDEVIAENDYLNSIINQLPRVSSTGDTITLNNTIEAKMKSKLSPSEMTQDGTPTPETPYDIHTTTGDNVIRGVGQNLLNIFDIKSKNPNVSVDEDGWITMSGNNTGSGSLFYNILLNPKYDLQKDKTYRCFLEVKNVSGSGNLTINEANASQQFITTYSVPFSSVSSNHIYYKDITTKSSFRDTNQLFTTYAFWNAGLSGSITFRLSLLDTTITENEFVYEPYNKTDYLLTLGDLEYSKIGNYEDEFILTTGKNLVGQLQQGGLNNGAETGATNRVRTDFIEVISNEKYTISNEDTIVNQLGLSFYDESKTFISAYSGGGWVGFPQTITMLSNAKYIKVMFRNSSNVDITPNLDYKIQIEKGSTATEYEPFNNGKWYLKKNTNKYTLTGDSSENWSYETISGLDVFEYNISDMKYTNVGLGLSNYYTNWNVQYAGASDGIIRFGWSNRYIYCYNDTTRFSGTLANWKTWLSTHNLDVYYVLDTPTYTLLNDTLQTQLTNIYNNMVSKKGTTNISQINDGLPVIISASALLDLNTLVGN